MPKVFDAFLDQVLSQIRCKQAHEGVREELASHLEDQAEVYEKQGQDADGAMQEAVRQMGDPVIIGGQLDAVHRPRPDWFVLVLALALVAGGAVSQVLIFNRAYYLQSLFFGVLFGVAALIIIYFLDYTILIKKPLALYIGVAVICMLPYLLFSGYYSSYGNYGNFLDYLTANHYVNYLSFLFVPVFCGILYNRKNKGKTGFLFCVLLLLLPIAVCVFSLNFSSFTIICASCFLLLLAAIKKDWFAGKKLHLFLMLLIPVAVFFITFSLPQITQLINIYKNVGNPRAADVHYLLSNAQFIGQSPVWQTQNEILRTPSTALGQTGFWLMTIVGMYGWAAGLALIAGITLLLWRMFVSALRQKNALGYYVCLSVALLITFQCIAFLLMNFGLIIGGEDGFPLIFNRVSGIIVNLCLIGLFLSACKFGKTAYGRSVSFERKSKA